MLDIRQIAQLVKDQEQIAALKAELAELREEDAIEDGFSGAD